MCLTERDACQQKEKIEIELRYLKSFQWPVTLTVGTEMRHSILAYETDNDGPHTFNVINPRKRIRAALLNAERQFGVCFQHTAK